jgi:hypothetical protein
MPRIEKWTRDGEHVEPREVSAEQAEAEEQEAFDPNSNIARTRVLD